MLVEWRIERAVSMKHKYYITILTQSEHESLINIAIVPNDYDGMQKLIDNKLSDEVLSLGKDVLIVVEL